jgi:glycosyltransferase involved in cell wall biosynthesis
MGTDGSGDDAGVHPGCRRLRVTLVSTVLNEGASIGALIDAIDAQTRPPDEIVIADGGSRDGTPQALAVWAARNPAVTVLSIPGANISAGRNAAIAHAAGPLIAVTDAGGTPEPGWLEALVAGFSEGVDVVMGFYRPDPRTRFERIFSCLNLPDASEVDPAKFMPSSRSVAFTKAAWEEAGGYPEWLDIGEDMFFNFQLVRHGAKRVFAPAALVNWRLRPDLRSTFRQYYRYARGDGKAGMYPRRHTLRFGTYFFAALLLRMGKRRPALLLLLVAALPARMAAAYRRAYRRLPPDELAQAVVLLPALEVFIDLAKMAGYLAGATVRLKAAARPKS